LVVVVVVLDVVAAKITSRASSEELIVVAIVVDSFFVVLLIARVEEIGTNEGAELRSFVPLTGAAVTVQVESIFLDSLESIVADLKLSVGFFRFLLILARL